MVILSGGLWLERLNGGATVNVWPLYGLIFLPFATVGALVAALRPRNTVGWIFLWGGLLNIVWSTAHHYAVHTLFVRPGVLPGLPVALFLANDWVSSIGIGLIVFLAPLLFPDGRLPSPHWRLFMRALLVNWGISLLAELLLPGPLAENAPLDRIANPLGIPALEESLAVLLAVTGLLMLLFEVGTVISLVVRYRHADATQRQQIKWFAFTMGLLLLLLLIGFASRSLNFLWLEATTESIGVMLIAAVPVAVGIAILRHQLFDIDVIIRRTLVYTLLTLTLGAIYLGSVVALQALFVRLTGQESTLAVVTSTLAIAMLFQPLRWRAQAFIDRRFFRKKYDARQVLATFARHAQQEADLDAVSADILGVVQETLEPERVQLWLRKQ
ncbi:MAG TPA: hypothetical protein PKD53_05950 [Chloroflexaceae bacterium]|nr:hypothetical protein [Chloroflexaceae bacterium]